MDAVVAKMQVQTIEDTRWGKGEGQLNHKVTLGAVYGTEGENKDFADATPSGACWMNISHGRPALDFFEPGAKYYVTFTRAPE